MSQSQSQHTPAGDDATGDEAADAADQLVGSYRLVSLRSRGAGCQVWSAVHRPTEMGVVMEIYPKTGDDKRLVESIVHKLDQFVELADCRVLRLLEVIDSDTAIFLVYEHYSSQSLEQYVLNCPINGKEFQRLVRSLIKIVQRLHSNCFFHGTLNADCFVLTRQKKIKFKDAPDCHLFVRSDIEPSRFDALMSKASDVWSLGALIYRLVASQLDRLQLLPGSATDEAVTHSVAELNPALSDLLARMTDQNPTARIGTADCLRHPFLVASSLLRLAPDSSASSNRGKSTWPAVSRDVVRFLARATGAPEAALTDAVASNDLSSWSAAYWLLKQRIAAGGGFPTLNDAATDDEATENDGSSMPPQPPTAPTKTATTTTVARRGFRRTLRQLRDRRLGLRSPDAAATTASSGGGIGVGGGGPSTASSGRRLRWGRRPTDGGPDDGNAQPPPPPPPLLPPIRVGPAPSQPALMATTSRRGVGGGGAEAQKLPTSSRRRNLSYLGGGDGGGGVSGDPQRPEDDETAAAEPVPHKTVAESPRGTSSEIRVNVQQRTGLEQKQQLLPLPPGPQQHQHQHLHQYQHQHQDQQQGNRQPSVLTQWSPRQPPNSRTELAGPGDYGEATAAAGAAAAAAAAGHAGDEAGDGAAFQLPETVYLWENAVVRKQQWMRARVF